MPRKLGARASRQTFLSAKFSEKPSGHGRLRCKIVDVRTKECHQKVQCLSKTASFSRTGFCRNPRGIFPNEFPGEFCLGFFGPFSLEKQQDKIHPKIHGNFQIRIWEFRGQNPHCKDPALIVFLFVSSTFCVGGYSLSAQQKLQL